MDPSVDAMAVDGQEPDHDSGKHTIMGGQDTPMDGDESVNTITASSVQALPDMGYSNGGRPSTSYSDTAFSRSQSSRPGVFTPNSDADTPPRYSGYHSGQNYQPNSRPNSSLAGRTYHEQNQRSSQAQQETGKNTSVVIKVGMVGDAQIGKTSLMVKYVEGSWDEDYIQTLGVNFMEKTISIRNTEITFSIWDLGGQREFVNMLPLVCNDAVAILFMFDLTRKSTLNSIKEWYRQGRGFNKTAIPFLVGTKYDHFVNFPREEQEEISNQAKRFAKAMKASLIFSSTSHSINVQKIFKIVLSKAFDLRCTIPEIENIGEPLLLYQSV
ncbi:small GTPase [Pseudovirgaria hyperparasitica]|uniref:Small GTPase n=1 Tax=Pseudovirgaria hyperparasitica TaxID=470096 RepID=A0A6A6WKV5_9PEZI|nr:small GTPase [Pseudovirgaria hyperparasitica]KAF2762834.1 small GTPase [Pseudovirgaria hyperparasitica]